VTVGNKNATLIWAAKESAVIPSRADDEGPHKRYRLTQTTATIFATPIFVDRESGLA
jgi:hypothetical protein